MSQWLSALNAASRRRVRFFAVKLMITSPFAIMFSAANGYPLFRSLTVLCGWQSLFAAAISFAQRS